MMRMLTSNLKYAYKLQTS